MYTQFASVAGYLKTVEAAAQTPAEPSGEDYTMWFGVGMYRLWKEEWSQEKPFEAAIRYMLASKAKSRGRFRSKYIDPAEAHLLDLFGIDWRTTVT